MIETATAVTIFFGGLLAPLPKPLVGMATDYLEVLRFEGRARLAERTQKFMSDRGLTAATRPVLPTFLVPLLECATIESDDDLQDRWARMLANAADANSKVEPRVAYIAMLKEMTPLDVLIMSTLHATVPAARWAHLETYSLPSAAIVREKAGGEIKDPSPDVEVSLGNLSRLGCLTPASVMGGYDHFGLVKLTELGTRFVKACS